MLAFAKFCNKSQRFARVKREVGREDFRFTSKCLLQCLGRYAAARSEEAVKEKDFCSHGQSYILAITSLCSILLLLIATELRFKR